jgi:hypothetical protein
VAATSAALVPTSASAAITDGGTLADGQRATATFAAADDEVTFSLTVPAGARPSVTFETPSSPAIVLLSLEWPDGTAAPQGHYFSFDPSSAFVEMDPNAQEQARAGTLRLHGNIAGTVSFVLRYAQDVSVALTSGSPMTLDFSDPAQQARLTFDATADTRVHLSVITDTLAPAAPEPDFYRRLTLFLTPQFSVFQEGSPAGTYQPLRVLSAGPTSILVDPGRDLTGTVTLIATVVPGDVPELAYDAQPRPVTLDGTGAASAAFVTRSGGTTMVQAVEPSLARADGTQGSAALVLEVPGAAPVTLGSVDASTVAFPAGAALDAGLVAFVRVVGDGTTTGTVGLRVFFDRGPSTPITLGAANAVTVPAATGRGRFSVDAAVGDLIEVYLTDVAFTDPGSTSGFTLLIEDGVGGAYFESQLTATGGSASFTAGATGTYTFDLHVDGIGGLTGTLLPVLSRTTRRQVPIGFDAVVGTTDPGEVLELVVPRSAGDTLAATVTAMSANTFAFISLAPSGESSATQPVLESNGTVFLEAGRIDSVGDWVLRVDPAGSTTAQVRVRLADQAIIEGQLAPVGTPTAVDITERGGIARFTFDGTAGDPLMLDLGEATQAGGTEFDTFAVDVLRPDGTSYASTTVRAGSGPAWLEVPDGLDVDGTWSVVVDPTGAATGSFTITRRVPRVLSGTLLAGTAQRVAVEQPGDVLRLTFNGRAGRRPVVTISDRTVATRMRLIGPTGLVLSDTSAFDSPSYLEFPVLPTTGSWTLELDPFARDTGSVRLLLGLVTDPVNDVRPGAATAARYGLGQNPRVRVAVDKGAHVAVDLRAVQPAGTRLNVFFERPDGSIADAQNVAAGSWVEVPGGADVGGRWTVVLDPEGQTVGTIALTVYASTDKVVTGRVGKTTGIEVRTPAQNVVLPFRGMPTTGEARVVSWKITDTTLDEATIRLVSPAGTTFASDLIGPGDRTGVFQAPTDMNGTWQLVVDPVDGRTGRARVFFAIGDLP